MSAAGKPPAAQPAPPPLARTPLPGAVRLSVVQAALLRRLLVVAPGAEYPTLFSIFQITSSPYHQPQGKNREPVGGGGGGRGRRDAGQARRAKTAHGPPGTGWGPESSRPAWPQSPPSARRSPRPAGQQVLHGAAAGILPAPRRAGPLRCRTENMRLPVSWPHGPGMPASRRLGAYKNERCE